jgi:hypothetical protein
MAFQQDYPPAQLSYNTLTLPSTFTNYCYQPNCPTAPFPYDKYKAWYTAKQKTDYAIGMQRYLQSRQPQYDNDPAGCPVFNSNMAPLAVNYLHYGGDSINPGGYEYVRSLAEV